MMAPELKVRAIFLGSTALSLSMLPVCPAFAQSTATSTPQPENPVNQPARTNQEVGAPTPGTAVSAAEPQKGLGDIVITAQRRSENLQKAAIPVSVVSGSLLRDAGVTRPAELTALVPALQVAGNGGPYNLFYLRGVGNFSGNPFADSAVSFNVDGVYVGRPTSTSGFFYDLERVEVVKGPQGTLYGRNATGGAINVITHKPELDHFGVEASAEYGNYDALRLDAAINVPLGDKAAFRVAGIRVRHDGYMNDGTDDQDDWGLRGSLRIDPASNLRVNVVADYFDQGGNGVGASPILAPSGVQDPTSLRLDDRIGWFSQQGQAVYTSQIAGTLGRTFYPFPTGFRPFQRNHNWGISSTIDWTTKYGTLTVIPGYRESHLNFLMYAPGFEARQRENGNQTTLEARFATTESKPLRAIVGAFYYKDSTKSPEMGFIQNWNGVYQSISSLKTESKALFGRLTYAITPDVRLTAGARQTWEDKSFEGTSLSLTRVCFVPLAFGGCPTAPPLPYGTTPPDLSTFPSVIVPAFGPPPYGGFPDVVTNPNLAQFATALSPSEQKKFKKLTWRIGADWDITPRNLLYVSYETGFKAGGFFFSPLNGVYKPETIGALTVGSKNRFMDNRLQLNVELFRWRYKDQQISHLINVLGVATFATENVGKATFKGFEVETRFAATPTTTLTADFQFLDAKYDKFVLLQANLFGATSLSDFNGTGCPTTGFDAASGNSFIVDCSGQRPPNAPKWTLNLGAEQRIPVSFGEFVIDARTHYQSKTLVGLEFVPYEYQKAYWLADAQVTYYAPEHKYFVGAFVNNIFDETLKQSIFPTPGTSLYATTLRPPRTYGVRAGVKF